MNDWVDAHPLRTTYVLRGEGLVYKRDGISDTPNLTLYTRLTTDRTYATEHDLIHDIRELTPNVARSVSPMEVPAHPANEFVEGSSRDVRGAKRALTTIPSASKKRRVDEGGASLGTPHGQGTPPLQNIIEISSDEEDVDASPGTSHGHTKAPPQNIIEISSDEEDADLPEVIEISDDDE